MSPDRFSHLLLKVAMAVALFAMVTTFMNEHPVVWLVRAGMTGLVMWQVWLFWRHGDIMAAIAERRASENQERLALEREAAAHRRVTADYERAQHDEWYGQAVEKAKREARAGGPGLSPVIQKCETSHE